MKQCAICGHAAERGSMCHDCRAALKRARDQTVSQFQALPALAIAGAAPAPGLRLGRSAPDRRGARPHPPRVKPAGESMRKTRVPMAGARGSVLLEIPPGTRSAPFVWVIVTLMVFVVTYVAYRVFVTASETSLPSTVPAATAPEDPAVPTTVREAQAEPAGAAPHAPAGEAPPPMIAPVQPSTLGNASTAPVVQDPVTKIVPLARSAERRPVPAATAAPDIRPAPATREFSSSRVDNAAPPTPSAAATAKPGSDAGAEPRPGRNAGSIGSAPGRSRESGRSDHWQRMATAVKACNGQDFLGGVLCEQKVRLEYCEGYWGQAAECPGGVANDHGQ